MFPELLLLFGPRFKLLFSRGTQTCCTLNNSNIYSNISDIIHSTCMKRAPLITSVHVNNLKCIHLVKNSHEVNN